MSTSRRRKRRIAAALLLAATAVLPAACSEELASFQDVYVPQSIEETYPIRVADRPVKLTVAAAAGRLGRGEAAQVTGFAREAAAQSASPVTVAYAPASKAARQAAGQAAGILERHGVPRSRIRYAAHDGRGNAVTLSFTARVAVTKPCGDWSQDTRSSQRNETGPNFGCAFQQNTAAMVSNPDDFVRPRPMTPASSAAQSTPMKDYQSGEWTTPTASSNTAMTNSGSGS